MTNYEYIYKAKVVNVVDGDTVDMQVDLGFYTFVKERFRLARIDTPELNSAVPEERDKAKQAKEYMMQYLDKNVIIKSFKKDKYGRFLAEIYTDINDPISVNDTLIQKGLATIWRG
jgi:micrococcal nuclease